jgi:hypothetical protein
MEGAVPGLHAPQDNLDDERNVSAADFHREDSNKPGDNKISDPAVAKPGLGMGNLIAQSHATETEVVIIFSCSPINRQAYSF